MTGRWRAAFAVAMVVIVASHIAGLGTAPPGPYNDEAAVGYNAWTIAHYGTDQFGTSWPLLFRDFGDYGDPATSYILAPLTLFLPLTLFVERIPSAVEGIALAMVVSYLAWLLTRSRAVALVMLLEASFEPWPFILSHINLDAQVYSVLFVTVALLPLAKSRTPSWRGAVLMGIAFGLAEFGAQPTRYMTPVLLAVLLLTYRRSIPWKKWLVIAGPTVLAATLIAISAGSTARLSSDSVFTGRSLIDGLWLWWDNFLYAFSPNFLLVDSNTSLGSTGIEGLVFMTSVPALLLGLFECFKRRREPFAQLVVAGMVLAAAGNAVAHTGDLRDVVVLPFFFVLLTWGWQRLLPMIGTNRVRAIAAAVVALITTVPYYVDYAVSYPYRIAPVYDAGESAALTYAVHAAAGRTVFISGRIDEPVEEALFGLQISPHIANPKDYLHFQLLTKTSSPSAGDIAVERDADALPANCTLIDDESVFGSAHLGDAPSKLELVRVCRFR